MNFSHFGRIFGPLSSVDYCLVLDVVIINNDRFFHPTNLTWIPKNKAVENISFVSFDI